MRVINPRALWTSTGITVRAGEVIALVTIRAPASGEIFLTVNDNLLPGNSGAWIVAITREQVDSKVKFGEPVERPDPSRRLDSRRIAKPRAGEPATRLSR